MKTSTIEKSIEIEYIVTYILNDDTKMDMNYSETFSILSEALEQVELYKDEFKDNLYNLYIETRIINISNNDEIVHVETTNMI